MSSKFSELYQRLLGTSGMDLPAAGQPKIGFRSALDDTVLDINEMFQGKPVKPQALSQELQSRQKKGAFRQTEADLRNLPSILEMLRAEGKKVSAADLMQQLKPIEVRERVYTTDDPTVKNQAFAELKLLGESIKVLRDAQSETVMPMVDRLSKEKSGTIDSARQALKPQYGPGKGYSTQAQDVSATQELKLEPDTYKETIIYSPSLETKTRNVFYDQVPGSTANQPPNLDMGVHFGHDTGKQQLGQLRTVRAVSQSDPTKTALIVDEVQSDPMQRATKEIEDARETVVGPRGPQEPAGYRANTLLTDVERTPLATGGTFEEIAARRAIMQAVEAGDQEILLTNGLTQVRRYGLSGKKAEGMSYVYDVKNKKAFENELRKAGFGKAKATFQPSDPLKDVPVDKDGNPYPSFKFSTSPSDELKENLSTLSGQLGEENAKLYNDLFPWGLHDIVVKEGRTPDFLGSNDGDVGMEYAMSELTPTIMDLVSKKIAKLDGGWSDQNAKAAVLGVAADLDELAARVGREGLPTRHIHKIRQALRNAPNDLFQGITDEDGFFDVAMDLGSEAYGNIANQYERYLPNYGPVPPFDHEFRRGPDMIEETYTEKVLVPGTDSGFMLDWEDFDANFPMVSVALRTEFEPNTTLSNDLRAAAQLLGGNDFDQNLLGGFKDGTALSTYGEEPFSDRYDGPSALALFNDGLTKLRGLFDNDPEALSIIDRYDNGLRDNFNFIDPTIPPEFVPNSVEESIAALGQELRPHLVAAADKKFGDGSKLGGVSDQQAGEAMDFLGGYDWAGLLGYQDAFSVNDMLADPAERALAVVRAEIAGNDLVDPQVNSIDHAFVVGLDNGKFVTDLDANASRFYEFEEASDVNQDFENLKSRLDAYFAEDPEALDIIDLADEDAADMYQTAGLRAISDDAYMMQMEGMTARLARDLRPNFEKKLGIEASLPPSVGFDEIATTAASQGLQDHMLKLGAEFGDVPRATTALTLHNGSDSPVDVMVGGVLGITDGDTQHAYYEGMLLNPVADMVEDGSLDFPSFISDTISAMSNYTKNLKKQLKALGAGGDAANDELDTLYTRYLTDLRAMPEPDNFQGEITNPATIAMVANKVRAFGNATRRSVGMPFNDFVATGKFVTDEQKAKPRFKEVTKTRMVPRLGKEKPDPKKHRGFYKYSLDKKEGIETVKKGLPFLTAPAVGFGIESYLQDPETQNRANGGLVTLRKELARLTLGV